MTGWTGAGTTYDRWHRYRRRDYPRRRPRKRGAGRWYGPVAARAGALGKLVADFGIRLEDVECVAATGAGSRVLTKSLLGRPVIKVNEFTAIGIGGPSLARLE